MKTSTAIENEPVTISAQTDYWMRKGPKTAAFLLVIPGATIIGLGIGLLLAQPVDYSVIGFGTGLLIWGLLVALTD